MRLLLILIPALLCVYPCSIRGQQMQTAAALNYWVDSVRGSDSNPPGLPYATIAHLTSIDASHPRPVWNVAYGSTFREQLSFPRINMTAQGYGSGAKPMLDGSIVIPNANWSPSAGHYNVTVAVPQLDQWVNVFRNGVFLAAIDFNLTTLDAAVVPTYTTNAYSGATTNAHTSPVTISINVQADPRADGALYEYSYQSAGLYSLRGGTFRNLECRAQLGLDGCMAFENTNAGNGYAYNIEMYDGNKHNGGVFVNNSNQRVEVHGCKTARSYYGSGNAQGKIMLVYSGGGGSTGSFLFDGCSIDAPSISDGIGGHVTAAVGSITFTNNTSPTQAQLSVGDAQAAAVLWSGNYGPLSLVGEGTTTSEVTGNTITSPGGLIAQTSTQAGNAWNIHDNPLLQGQSTLGLNIWGTASITNNTIKGVPITTGTASAIYCNSACFLTLSGNTISAPGNLIYAASATSTITSDYNTWIEPHDIGSTQFNRVGTTWFYGAYASATGNEAHSTVQWLSQPVSGQLATYEFISDAAQQAFRVWDTSGGNLSATVQGSGDAYSGTIWTTNGSGYAKTALTNTLNNGVNSVVVVFKASAPGSGARTLAYEFAQWQIGLNGGAFSVYDWKNSTLRTSGTTLSDGSWHAVLCTYGTTANTTNCYLDGSTSAFFTTTAEMPAASNGSFNIGSQQGSQNIAASYAFLSVYDHNLTVTPTTGEWPLLYAWLKSTELANNHPEVSLP